MKECNQCKKEFPATKDYFYSQKKVKSGLYSICKKCKNENVKKHYKNQETKEKRTIYDKEYRKENKKKYAAYMKQYREKNKEKIVEDKKRYYEENKETISANYKQYREKNKEQILFKDKKYLYEKLYMQTQKGKDNRYNSLLKNKSYKHGVLFTSVKRSEILIRDNWTCQLCGIKVHDRRTNDWNTHDKANIDHIIPISKGGDSEPNNLQVLCRTCNIIKGDNVYIEKKKIN